MSHLLHISIQRTRALQHSAQAFKKGVEKNEFVDISDDIYSEEEEF